MKFFQASSLKFFVLLLLLSGCSQGIKTEQDFYKWLNDEHHGLSKVRKAGGIAVSLKYLPAEFIAWKEAQGKGLSKAQSDSLNKLNQGSLTFLLTIAPENKERGGDVMYYGVSNEQEYKQKSYELNFRMGEFITIKSQNKDYHPLFVTLENTYSVTNSRTFYVVFSQKEIPSEDSVQVVFNDEFFGTGINHFNFKRSDFNNVPALGTISP